MTVLERVVRLRDLLNTVSAELIECAALYDDVEIVGFLGEGLLEFPADLMRHLAGAGSQIRRDDSGESFSLVGKGT